MSTPLSRRNFLVAGLTVPLVAAGSPALAVEDHDRFRSAAKRYHVPASVLAAFSYDQSRWEDHAGVPSTSQGYGPMHLIDGAAAQASRRVAGKRGTEVVDTLGRAARLTGMSTQRLRNDPQANILGAAAVIADSQRTLGYPTGTDTDPATWYAAVATSSGLVTADAQRDFADDLMADLRKGVSKHASGMKLSLKATHVGDVHPQRKLLTDRAGRSRHHRHHHGPVDAPRGLHVEWIEAPYENYGDDPTTYGNHDLGHRPHSPALNQIVIHDTEGYWDTTIDLVKDPTYLAWNYTVRSHDGHIAQHLRTKDIGWHAGNWYVNTHSIGIEHEGFAPQGAKWFSEPLYRRSARLVSYLCREYRIPMDRAHIIGHDQVPAIGTAYIPGMHWDPGPFWDWEHYFDVMGAPLRRGTSRRRARRGDVVRILPGFDDNQQPVSGCGDDPDAACPVQGTNFVTLRTAPSHDAQLVNDPGLHQDGQPATTEVSDISARAGAGTDFVVADLRGDWTAIWYLGVKAWFHNPHHHPVTRTVVRGRAVTPKGDSAPIYGTAYPEASAYTDPDDVQPVEPLLYTARAGQAYAVVDEHVPTDYYKAKTFSPDTPDDHIDIVGEDRYYMVNFGHRIGFVRAADVRHTGWGHH